MDGEARRKKIMEILEEGTRPISGTELSKMLGVSRQIVVGDVALMRAANSSIIATNKGYILDRADKAVSSIRLRFRHKPEDIFDELCTITDLGARVKNIEISHPVYGEVSVDINVNSRVEAKEYAQAMMETSASHLSSLTGNYHFHEISADNELTLLRVQKALNDKGYLVKQQ